MYCQVNFLCEQFARLYNYRYHRAQIDSRYDGHSLGSFLTDMEIFDHVMQSLRVFHNSLLNGSATTFYI